MTKNEIREAMDVLTSIDEPKEERHYDEALSVLMSFAEDPHTAVNTGHPSASPFGISHGSTDAHDNATEALEDIATGRRDDVAYLVAIANGESKEKMNARG